MMNFSNLSTNIANAGQPTSQQPAQSTNGQALPQTMRLRDEPPAITPPTRNPRKRKSPPATTPDSAQPQQPATQPQPQSQPQQLQHVLPPPHTIMHQLPPGAMPPYQYTDYSPGGMPPPPPNSQPDQSGSTSSGQRALSSSKRAEQNRKAQRAFRERRDQHVKALESRSQLLDAALASADEANRRWEECRALVDQLRVENAALRAALSQAQLLSSTTTVSQQPEETKKEGASENNTNVETSQKE
ncbi:uncharacterized protein EV420DRAFT_1531741 [Desarmillaria tabescens]|uniref:BZIP domain-containing protein n=1 Tax=Armillaria tabescens TaxID=1929756 RepID=A0AA39TNX4_ARMTA|nr:uncharacterized protein EV420DRAFT_1531741 [Desarmillaria tabescens]KAK0461368.1 hypothetical protein EV420DRAFT_1531741 [Desarmillaria tabescens]